MLYSIYYLVQQHSRNFSQFKTCNTIRLVRKLLLPNFSSNSFDIPSVVFGLDYFCHCVKIFVRAFWFKLGDPGLKAHHWSIGFAAI